MQVAKHTHSIHPFFSSGEGWKRSELVTGVFCYSAANSCPTSPRGGHGGLGGMKKGVNAENLVQAAYAAMEDKGDIANTGKVPPKTSPPSPCATVLASYSLSDPSSVLSPTSCHLPHVIFPFFPYHPLTHCYLPFLLSPSLPSHPLTCLLPPRVLSSSSFVLSFPRPCLAPSLCLWCRQAYILLILFNICPAVYIFIVVYVRCPKQASWTDVSHTLLCHGVNAEESLM